MVLNKILEFNAIRFANRPAFTMQMGYRTVTLNYKQVFDLSRRVALFLRDNGVGKRDKFVVFAQNSPYWGCVFWGSLLNGSIIVPANVQSTQEIVDRIVKQVEAKLIFKSRYLRYDSNIPCFTIDFIDEFVECFNPDDLEKTDIAEDDLIQILYTSGTTGDPKGVLLTHKNIYSNLDAISKLLTLKSGASRVLSILPLTHIFEQTIGFFLPSFYAAQIIYAHSYAAIGDLLREYKIDKMVAVPEFLKIFMRRIKSVVKGKGGLAFFNKFLNFSYKLNCKVLSRILFYPVLRSFGGNLDTIVSGGAPLDPELEKEWESLGIYLLQGYGLTETSPVVTTNTYKIHKLASVGKALQGVDVKIEKDGEILVKGPNVFQGYFKNEKETRESFTDDGWFKTGDIGYFDKDGFLFLKGRKKYMILGPGGQSVFPEDIEFELNKIDEVKDSCVIELRREGGNVEIHAVLLLDERVDDLEKIIEQANSRLASYQRINSWSLWDEVDFPRSATRKVKRDEVLKRIYSQRIDVEVSAVKYGVNKVINILSQISEVAPTKISSTTKIIRDLNMDSLMKVELVMRLEMELGVSIDETQIEQSTTVADLEKIVEQSKGKKRVILLKNWPRSWWASFIRLLGQGFAILLGKIFIKLEVEGVENLSDLDLPVIFMPNHISYIDSLVVIMALPIKLRKKLAFAAAKDVLYEEFGKVAWLAELFFNTYSLPRLEDESIRPGLESTGKLLDEGYSIVFFPEGRVSLDGKFQPLRLGAGFMAIEMGTDVISMKIEGTDKLVPYAKLLPQGRGVVKVKFGKLLKFKKSELYESSKNRIEEALKNL